MRRKYSKCIHRSDRGRKTTYCILKRLCNSHLCKKPFSLTTLTVARYLWSMTTQDRDVVQTKQSYSVFEDTKRRAKSHCLILTKVGLFLLWSFKRFTAHKTFIEMPIAET
ncbi:High osmolarity signaling protein [Trichinella spiralis]|uniref:High osmolarity signaling protein n=1 Tax=Trichinella spiralis TaxID=6334 RepID=A0ABR3KWU1_TRISP